MKFVNIVKITLAGLLTTLFQTTFAEERSPNCPVVDLVSQAWEKMDNAIPDDHSYIVNSKPIIHFSERLWSVRINVPARNQEDAIKLAQITVKETKALITPNAIKIFNQYACMYFSARAYVYAWTQTI